MTAAFRLIPNKSIEDAYAKAFAEQREEILSGKLSIRWSQACCGYRIRAGRNALLGVETFMTEKAAIEWMKETHNIDFK